MNALLSYIKSLPTKLHLWNNPPPLEMGLPPLTMYRTCAKLPMSNFIECICDNNLSALVISGDVMDYSQLEEQWIIILSEYYELRGDGIDDSDYVIVSREIRQIQNHLFLVDRCIRFLREQYSDEIVKSLRKLGYPTFKPTSKNPDDYAKLLDDVNDRSKTKFIRLQQLIKELERIVEKTKDVKISRKDFEMKLIYIEEMQKTSYSLDNISVQKFILLEKRYNDYIESLKKKT